MATKEKVTEMTVEQEKKDMEKAEEARVLAAQAVAENSEELEDEELLEEDDDLDADLEDMEDTGVMVSREKFVATNKKTKYWGYFVSGTVRKKAVKVSLTAPDIGGYEVLDIVFDGAKLVPLYRSPFEVKDNDGKVTASGYRYYAVSRDDEGMLYTAQVKPSRKSDQALLEMMIKAQLKLAEKQAEGGGSDVSAG